jgi:hypothetical protein
MKEEYSNRMKDLVVSENNATKTKLQLTQAQKEEEAKRRTLEAAQMKAQMTTKVADIIQ